MHLHVTAVIAAALTLAACGNSTGPTRYRAAGSWSGQETQGSTTISLILQQEGDSVMGTGTVTGARAIPVTAEGSSISTSFDLMLSAPGYQPVRVMGNFTSRDDIEAYMVGSGFYGDQVLLHRQ